MSVNLDLRKGVAESSRAHEQLKQRLQIVLFELLQKTKLSLSESVLS